MQNKSSFKKILIFFLSLLLLFQQCGLAQIAGELNIAGRIASIPNPFVQDAFRPLHLRYLSYDSANNNFKLLLDKGNQLNVSPHPKTQEVTNTTKALLEYFYIGLTLSSESFWVNLRPDDESNIIDSELAKTDMGKVMLEADLQLKKDTANATSPQTKEGKAYWDKLYKKASELFGSDNVTIPTLTRVWIVPDEIVIGETQTSAYIYKATLKVLLEQDYLSRQGNSEEAGSRTLISSIAGKDSTLYNFTDAKQKALNDYSSQLFRQSIIPKLNQQVNASKRYASLRQAYYSLIMAEWFKARFSDKKGLTPYTKGLSPQLANPKVTKWSLPDLIGSRNLNHLTSQEPWSKDTYFKAYQKSVNEGEYDIQQTQDVAFSLFHQTTKRYICGGVIFNLSSNMPALGGMSYTPGSGATTYSIPHANASPAVTGNTVGVEVDGADNPGETEDIRISTPLDAKDLSQGPGTPAKGQSTNEEAEVEAYLMGLRNPDYANAKAILVEKAKTNHDVIKQLEAALRNESDAVIRARIEEVIREANVGLIHSIGQGIKNIKAILQQVRQRKSKYGALPAPISAEQVRQNPQATAYSDGDFNGVDLEHFVHAQLRLARRELSVTGLRQVLIKLGLDPGLTVDLAYRRIYEELAKNKYNKEVIDLINGFDPQSNTSTYANPRLNITIIDQNGNPRAQGIYEAVANSLDALGFKIGQFGKGVKQIIDWLEPTGGDRIDVYSRKENGKAYQLSIIQDKLGQNYIQIREISLAKFQEIALKAAARQIDHGTILQIATQRQIPESDVERKPSQHNSLQEIVEGIHKRFPFVTAVEIYTQLADNALEEVNGFKEKKVIVPSAELSPSQHENAGRFVYVSLNTHSISVVDNGTGMDAAVLSGMFVPKGGTKEPQFLSGKDAQRELDRVKVVHDITLTQRVSFSRNGEVLFTVDVPQDIHPGAVVEGGLMVEFGLLLDVPESRNNIIIPQPKSGEQPGFQRAIMHAVNQIIKHPRLSNLEKARYINTIAIGLDGLIQGNENNNNAIKNIRAAMQDRLAPIIEELRKEGFIILLDEAQFGKIKVPQGKEGKVLFIHEGLFNWQGAVSLSEVGGEVIPLLKVGGEKRLPLVVVPFMYTFGDVLTLPHW